MVAWDFRLRFMEHYWKQFVKLNGFRKAKEGVVENRLKVYHIRGESESSPIRKFLLWTRRLAKSEDLFHTHQLLEPSLHVNTQTVSTLHRLLLCSRPSFIDKHQFVYSPYQGSCYY